ETLAHRAELLRARLRDTAKLDELCEEVLESGRRDDLQDPTGLVSRIPERMPLAARLMHKVSWTGLDVLVAKQSTHAPLDDKAVFVLVAVAMKRRRQRSRGHRVLDERETLIRLAAVHDEANSDTSKKPCDTVGCTDDLRCRDAHDSLSLG